MHIYPTSNNQEIELLTWDSKKLTLKDITGSSLSRKEKRCTKKSRRSSFPAHHKHKQHTCSLHSPLSNPLNIKVHNLRCTSQNPNKNLGHGKQAQSDSLPSENTYTHMIPYEMEGEQEIICPSTSEIQVQPIYQSTKQKILTTSWQGHDPRTQIKSQSMENNHKQLYSNQWHHQGINRWNTN